MHKVILITGAAKRIGAHCAHYFHEKGYNVALHYRHSHQEAEQIKATLNHNRENSCILIQADFTQSETDYSTIVKTVEETWGRLNILLNNASSFFATPIAEFTEENWLELMNSNLKAPLFLSQAARPLLQKSQGCIINMLDINTKNHLAQHSIYLSAKAGLENLTLSLAKELAPEVRVNGIAPGNILWPENKKASAQEKADAFKDIPLQRQGTPEDIAQTAFFLAEQASYITGNIINVDGGKLLI